MIKKTLFDKRIAFIGLSAVILMLLVALLGSAAGVGAQTPTTLHFPQPLYWITPGSTLTLDVLVDDADDLGGWEAVLSFDASRIALVGASEGAFLGTSGRTTEFMSMEDASFPGLVAIGGYSHDTASGVNGSGVLAHIQVQALATGETTLSLNDLRLARPDGEIVNPQLVEGEGALLNIAYPLDVTIADIGGGQAQLDWILSASDASFDVWKSDKPYFNPGDAGTSNITASCINNAGAVSCLNSGAVGDPALNNYYLIRTYDDSGQLLTYAFVGEFDFAVESG